MIESALTTIDNPHDPFTEFLAWFNYDAAAGYHIPSLLARLVYDSPELSSEDARLAQESVIDELVLENVTGVYKKVTREVPDPYQED